MRILFALAMLALATSATPVHASLGSAPQCVPPPSLADTRSTKFPVPKLYRSTKNFSAEDRDYLVRTIVFEAGTEPDEGKAAVAHVILNREKSGRWGDSIKEVVTAPWQFEPWMTKRKEIQSLSRNDPRYLDVAQIAEAVLSGESVDPTAGATHFLNPTIVRQRRGGSLPAWARAEGQPIGRHNFYKPDEGVPAQNLLTVSMDAFRIALSCSTQEQQAEDSDSLTPLALRKPTNGLGLDRLGNRDNHPPVSAAG